MVIDDKDIDQQPLLWEGDSDIISYILLCMLEFSNLDKGRSRDDTPRIAAAWAMLRIRSVDSYS